MRFFVHHNACLNASYDVNLLKEGLVRAGHVVVDAPEDADRIIFSGCAVRDLWVRDAAGQVNGLKARAPHAQVVLTGCAANVAAERLAGLAGVPMESRGIDEILQEHAGTSLREVDRTFTQGDGTNFENTGELTQLRKRVGPQKAAALAALQQIDREHGTELERLYRRTTKGFVFYHEVEPVEFVTVSRSCPYRCSFCAIPKGRGAFTSTPLPHALDKVDAALGRGVSHFLLVGDEVGSYGAGGHGPRFPDLAEQILARSPDVTLSVRYIEPKPFLRYFEHIRGWCRDGRVQLLYLSVQSGSQRILDAMNRNYTLQEFLPAYETLREESTTVFYSNWMVGFPGESEADYSATAQLVKRMRAHINVAIPFSARPDTPAATLSGQICDDVKAARMAALSVLIADEKTKLFEPHLGFLDSRRRAEALDLIRVGELVQYHE